jgi:hypothetical protein
MEPVVGFLEAILTGRAARSPRPRDVLKDSGKRVHKVSAGRAAKPGFNSCEVVTALEKTFVKERRVFSCGGDVFDRNGANDAYVHLRLHMLEERKGDLAAVPLVRSAYAYWDDDDAYWVGLQQEFIPETRSLHAVFMSKQDDLPAAERLAARAVARLLCSLKSFQEELWLTHNDLHMCNVYLRMNGTPVLADFDRSSICARSVASSPPCAVVYQNWWYSHACRATRDLHQLLAEVLGLLDAFARARGAPPEGATTRALRDLLHGGLDDEVNAFRNHVTDQRVLQRVERSTKEVWDNVARTPRGNVRVMMPNAVTLGVWPRPRSCQAAIDALADAETRAHAHRPAQGRASDWDVLEYAAQCYPAAESDVLFRELELVPRPAPPPRGRFERFWGYFRVKLFVDLWARYNLGAFWGAPTDSFSAGRESLSPLRRMALFTRTAENLQRAFAVFYEAAALDAPDLRAVDPFVLAHACALVVHGQTPLFSSAVFRDRRNLEATVSYVREVPNAAVHALVTRDTRAKNEPDVWGARCREAVAVADAVRALVGADAERARERLTWACPARWLYGSGAFHAFVDERVLGARLHAPGGKVDMRAAAHACLALVHPDLMYAPAWTDETDERRMATFARLFDESQLTYDITM